MKHRIHLPSLTLAAAMFGAVSPTWAGELRKVDKPVQGRYLVVLKEQAARLAGAPGRGPTASEVSKMLSATYGISTLASFDHVLRGFSANIDDATTIVSTTSNRTATSKPIRPRPAPPGGSIVSISACCP
jgi:hypothetical protein